MYKRNSKILATLLTIVLVFSIFPSLRVNAATIGGDCGANGNNLTWTFDDTTGTLTISGTGFMDDFSPSQAPWKDYLTDIHYIYISPGIASIGDHAFEGCMGVSSINIPSSVSKIGANAFNGCGIISSINFPGTITDIGKGAFSYTCISDIPSGLDISEIPECCFASCFNLKTVSIPSGVTKIDVMAFENCVNLKSITIPESVTIIGDYAFEDCTSLTTVTMNSSLAVKCKNYDVFADCPSSLKINYSDINFTYNSGGNGTVTGYVPGSDPTTVYLTFTPDTGYVVNTVTVTDSTEPPPSTPTPAAITHSRCLQEMQPLMQPS